MAAQDVVPGGGAGRVVLAELLDRFHALVGGAADEARPRGGGPGPSSPSAAAGQGETPSLSAIVDLLGPLPPDAVAALALGIAAELAHMHAAGSLHRRLMPSNVLLSESGPKLVHSGVPHPADGATITDLDGSPLVLGYLTPEQVLGQQVGPETDVFALGGLLAFAATGMPPFGIDEPLAVLYRIVNEEPALDAIPASLRGLVKACLSKLPAQRPALPTLTARATGVLKDARSAKGRAKDVRSRVQTPARLTSMAMPVTRRRWNWSTNLAVLATVIIGVAAAFLVRGVAESSPPSSAQSGALAVAPTTPAPTTATATTTATLAATATTSALTSAPLPGVFIAGPGCPASPWAGTTESVAPSGGLVPKLGGGFADCGGRTIAFTKTGQTAPGPSSFAWTFRLGAAAHCTLSVYVANANPSSGYAHYRLEIPASNPTKTVIFQINQSAAKGRWVAAPELAGLSLPDGSVRLVLTDAGAYAGDTFHVTASAVQASCSPAG